MKPTGSTIALCAVLILAGCGGSGGSSNSSTETSAPVAGKAKQRVASAKAPPAKKVEASSLVPKKAEPRIVVPKPPPPKKEVLVKDLKKGSGAVAHTGDLITVDFLGVYYSGKTVMSSWERHESFTFELGGGDGVLGWEHALQGMRVGGRRQLIVPRHLTSRYALPSEERSQIYVIDLRGIGQPVPASSE